MTKHDKTPLQRLLAMLLCLVMVVGMFPATANAAEDDSSGTLGNNSQAMETVDTKNNVVLSKQAELTEDGTYSIQLSAYSTAKEAKTEVSYPLDFIFILDASGSMAYDSTGNVLDKVSGEILEKALEDMIGKISEKAKLDDDETTGNKYLEHRAAFITFANDDSGGGNYHLRSTFNGRFKTWGNTGLFVNGEFKNYHSGSAATDYYYSRAYDLDKTKSYYLMNSSAVIREMTWSDDEDAWEIKATGTNINPRTSADDPVYGHRQFYTRSEEEITYSELTSNDYASAITNVNENGAVNPVVTNIVDSLGAHGNTYTEYGLIMAKNVLDNTTPPSYVDKNGIPRTGKQVVILFTDGASTSYAANNYAAANAIKSIPDTKLYTIAVGNIASGDKTELERISSNYSDSTDTNTKVEDAKYYYPSNDMEDLYSIFNSILEDVVTDSTTLDESSVLIDYMNIGFVLPEGFNENNITLQVQDMKLEATQYVPYGDVVDCTPIEINGDVLTYKYGDDTLTLNIDRENNSVSVTGFDYKEYATYSNHPGKKLILTLNGIQMTEDVHMDETVATNKGISGVGNFVSGVFTPITRFPQPVTMALTKTYVLDYAKDFEICPCAWFADIEGMGTAPTIEPITSKGSVTVSTDYGTFVGTRVDEHADAIEGHNHLNVKFTPKTMQWDEPASLFLLGKNAAAETAALADAMEDVTTGDYMWGKINVIPANNIYYEDDFVSDDDTGVVGIEYSGNWTTSNTTNEEHHEGDENTTTGGGGIHGWEDSLADDAQDSGGSSTIGTGSKTDTATATFTFTGCGVDIYSRTNGSSGTVMATLDNVDKSLKISKTLLVDTISESDEYYQIPTLSFMTYNNEPLPYGTYKVTIYVTTAAAGRFNYYMDGIRVYNPISNDKAAEDSLISDAYGDEIQATFTEVRDLLLQAEDFDADTTANTGAVFIDSLKEDQAPEGDSTVETTPTTTTNVIGVYKDYGPKNEVYLAQDQAITFRVDQSAGVYHIGLKAPSGESTTVALSKDAATNSSTTIAHTSDLYYKVTPVNGLITVMNTGENLLSVTKIKAAGTTAEEANLVLLDITAEEAVNEVAAFSLRMEDPYSADTEEEPVEPETPDVEINNPTEPEKPDDSDNSLSGHKVQAQIKSLLKTLFKNLLGWFR